MAQSFEFKITPREQIRGDSDLRARIIVLERAVQELQARVLMMPQVVGTVVSPNKWYCQAKAFMNSYDSFGTSELEAKVATEKKCRAENNEMHCHATCQESK